ncbi:TonB-dependent receptor plug domain-containing protein [Vacuolonema iberomarrocanum]|uniref:TonB-dependent receptor plug domain-containing protein n=1 Tax=Vacuolonema iberomarrocanum TaxID=3454632 RepID=UPI001A0F8014|nr:Plug domain-containing protein [filamentous cyanobacterium LEGE 07170]
MHYSLKLLSFLGFWGSVALLFIPSVAAQSNPLQLATSCLPGGADAPRNQGLIIDREQIEERSRFSQDLQDILTTEVPGFTTFGDRHPSLRGRPVRVFVDGVPVTIDELLSILHPNFVERIEVIPGPSILCST